MKACDGSTASNNCSLSIFRNYAHVGCSAILCFFGTNSKRSFLVDFEVAAKGRRSTRYAALVGFRYAFIGITLDRALGRVCRVTLSTRRSTFNFEIARACVMFSSRQFAICVGRSGRGGSFVIGAFFYRSFCDKASSTIFCLLRPLFNNREGK